MCMVFSCSQKEEKKNITSYALLNPLKNTSPVNLFDQLIDTAFIIPLEKTDKSFIVDITKILKTNDKRYIVLNTSNILLFDRQGRFLFEIGKMGRGPGEYMKIYDICLSNDETFIYALDCYNRVYKYSLSDGSFIDLINPSWAKGKRTCDGICIAENNGFFLFCSNPIDYNDFEKDFFCIGKFDYNGSFVGEFMKRMDFCLTPQRFTQSFNQYTYMRPLEGTSELYLIKNGQFDSKYQINFEDKEIPKRFIFNKNGNNASKNLPNYIKSPFYKLPIDFFDTQSQLYFKAIGPKGRTYEFLLNKNNLKGIRWSHSDMLTFNFQCSDSTFFYGVYNDIETPDSNSQIETEINQLRKYLVHKLELKPIDINSNPSIIAIKFRSQNHLKINK